MSDAKGNPLVRPHWRDGPLAGWLDAFADWVTAQGYARTTVGRKILLAACFSQWLEQGAIEFADINSGHPAQYLQHRARRLRPHLGDRAALRQLTVLGWPTVSWTGRGAVGETAPLRVAPSWRYKLQVSSNLIIIPSPRSLLRSFDGAGSAGRGCWYQI